MASAYRPSGRGPEVIAVFGFFVALTTSIIIPRVYVRLRLLKDFGLDDWTAVAGWLLFIFHAGFAIAGAYHGTGQRTALIQPPENIPIALKWWWVCEPLYVLSNMAVKLSIGLMLLRLLIERSHRILVWAVLGTLEVYSVVFFFIFVFQCYKPSFFWTRFQGETDGKCINTTIVIAATYVYSGITIMVDVTFAFLPWVMVRKLQMNQRTKLLVAIVLALGSIASAATIIRTPYISSMSDTAEFLYATTDVAIWSCVETGLSIAASSAATLKPLFKTFLARSKLFGRTTRANTYKSAEWPQGAKASYIRSYSATGSSNAEPKDIEMGSQSDILKTTRVDVQRFHRDDD